MTTPTLYSMPQLFPSLLQALAIYVRSRKWKFSMLPGQHNHELASQYAHLLCPFTGTSNIRTSIIEIEGSP